MKNYVFTLALLLVSLAAFSQQQPMLSDTPTITEPILIDTTAMPERQIAVDTPTIQLQPVVTDTIATTPATILKAEPAQVTQTINLNMQKGKLNVRAGSYYLAGGLPAMGIGAAMVVLSQFVKVKEPQQLKIAGYAFISIGGVFSITGLGHIIHGKKLMKK